GWDRDPSSSSEPCRCKGPARDAGPVPGRELRRPPLEDPQPWRLPDRLPAVSSVLVAGEPQREALVSDLEVPELEPIEPFRKPGIHVQRAEVGPRAKSQHRL